MVVQTFLSALLCCPLLEEIAHCTVNSPLKKCTLLDPRYWDVDGFWCLLQLEWCSTKVAGGSDQRAKALYEICRRMGINVPSASSPRKEEMSISVSPYLCCVWPFTSASVDFQHGESTNKRTLFPPGTTALTRSSGASSSECTEVTRCVSTGGGRGWRKSVSLGAVEVQECHDSATLHPTDTLPATQLTPPLFALVAIM